MAWRIQIMNVENKIAFSCFVSHKASGQTLLEFLAGRFTYFSLEDWQKRLKDCDVFLNGNESLGSELLKLGDEVRYLAKARQEPKVPTHISVLFEDEDLLIVNKPAQLPVHPGGRYLRNTLINLLKVQRKSTIINLAHRLDRETSGVCVLTKTSLAKDKMYWQFFNGEIDKTYWALVWGRPDPPSGRVDAPIGLSQKSKLRTKQEVGGKESKSAKTKYHTLGTKWVEAAQWTPPPWPALVKMVEHRQKKNTDFNGNQWPISLVECKPITGRTNQIRVHMAHLGSGIVGDKLYDPDEAVFVGYTKAWETALQTKTENPLFSSSSTAVYAPTGKALTRRLVLGSHALHAKKLSFRHPRSGKTLSVEAPLPKEWTGLYDRP